MLALDTLKPYNDNYPKSENSKMTTKFSLSELSALKKLKDEGSILTSKIPDKNETEFLSDRVIAGMSVYKKLIKKDLCFITEEEPLILDDGEEFEFTPSIELTDEGQKVISELVFPF